MPQIFGADQLEIIKESSLWASAGFDEDVEDHDRALNDHGFEENRVPTLINTSGFSGGRIWGQHLRSDKSHHTWVVARVANRGAVPNARETDVGGQTPRYAVEIHTVPRNPESTTVRGSITPLWAGNDIRHFLTGKGGRPGQITWPQVKAAMASRS